jgi:hypothetical protein
MDQSCYDFYRLTTWAIKTPKFYNYCAKRTQARDAKFAHLRSHGIDGGWL